MLRIHKVPRRSPDEDRPDGPTTVHTTGPFHSKSRSVAPNGSS